MVTFVGALDKADAEVRAKQNNEKDEDKCKKARLEHVRGNLLPAALAQGKKKLKKEKSSPGGC